MSEAAQLRLAPSEQSVVARYEALIRVSQAVSAYREPRKLFDVLVDELRRVIEFDGIGIAQYDETRDAIAWHVSIRCDEPNPVLKDKCVQKETMTCWVFQNQRALVIPFVDQETRFPDTMEFLKKHKLRSVCMLPLTTVHRRIGSMFIASEHPDAYSEDEVRFLGLVADQMALAIDDALNFEA
jgi:formate hydrogenlyase transcriptional activator